MDIETEKKETHVQSIEILPSLENIFLSHVLFDVMTSNTANLSRQQYYLSKKVNSELSVIPVFYIKNRYFTLKPENSPFLLQKNSANSENCGFQTLLFYNCKRATFENDKSLNYRHFHCTKKESFPVSTENIAATQLSFQIIFDQKLRLTNFLHIMVCENRQSPFIPVSL